ncbi:hypothetical protein OH540_09690 [Streptomyces sp. BPPL-273]|uniref:hypothetical protein n=1 Tax=Streptomyces sp. BPPL-273 TaxID=2987533 RepID=UPI0024AFED2A|nr:hypothetical protein [Streptomyces sp. BPPL-273]WHM30295.1 hypothetical protein OH540_09690 [Streptomyces sp. BPPL-273]
MSAFARLKQMIRTSPGQMTVWSEPEVSAAVDAFRAEVVAERDEQVVAWLVKRSREDEHGDVIARLASKVARGAVRPNNLRTFDLPDSGDPHLSAVAAIEKALLAYYEDAPAQRLTVSVLLANALCGERAGMAAAYRDAAELAARYAAGTVEQSVLRDLATELRRRAREVAS